MATFSKLKVSAFERRAQAVITTWFTPALAMSFLIMSTPLALHRNSCSRTTWALPSFCAIIASCAVSRRSPMPQPLQMYAPIFMSAMTALQNCEFCLDTSLRLFFFFFFFFSFFLFFSPLPSGGAPPSAGAAGAEPRLGGGIDVDKAAGTRRHARHDPGGVHRRLHADREHHEVMLVVVAMIALGVHAVQDGIARGLVLGDVGDLGLDEFHFRVGLDFLVEILEAVDGADVDVIDRDIGSVDELLAHISGLLERGHAADARAVLQMVAVARTGALDEGDILRLFTVRWAQELAAGGAEGVHQALELHAGDDVGITIVAVRLDFFRVVRLPAGGP